MLSNKKTRYLAVALIIIALMALLVTRAGLYLEHIQPPQPADAIVVLMGSAGDRALQAFELYEAGYADRIIMASDYEAAREQFSARGIHLPNNADKMRYLLTELGVADSLITTIPGNVRSTVEEARLLKTWLKQHPDVDTILLVTSAYHTRRTAITYRRTLRRLDQPPVLITTANAHSDFQARKWWRCRESAKRVAMEYSRLVFFRLTGR